MGPEPPGETPLMTPRVFSAIFDELPLPVLVARGDDDLSVVYLNPAAVSGYLPVAMRGERDPLDGGEKPLGQILRFQNPNKFTVFASSLKSMGSVDGMGVTVLSFQSEPESARAYAGSAAFDDGRYFVIALAQAGEKARVETQIVGRMLHASYNVAGSAHSIQSVLQLAGSHVGASHAFIFEESFGGQIRNTYEWTAEGAEPNIQRLQNVSPYDYAHNILAASGGLVAADDVRTIPNNRKMLELGLKSIAIFMLQQDDIPLGFIGFDDCGKNRLWSAGDIQLLKNTAGIISSMLGRRNAEMQSRRSEDIFRTVVDNIEELVYITDINTYEIKFVSKSLVRSLGTTGAELLGRTCWKTLHTGLKGPCAHCALPDLLARKPGDASSRVLELHNPGSGKWYLSKNNIIDWIDGKPVHLGALVDISYRKQYEEQLKRFAATDAMTDVFNRKWGSDKLSEEFAASPEERGERTLCFLDLDGLKRVNDSLGHAMGDEMIINTIQTIFSCVRRDDFIIRWGGDEFLVFLNCNLENAEKVLNKIVFAFDHFNSTRNRPYRLSASAGLVSFAEPFSSLDELIGEADRRMYRNKMEKRNRTGIFLR